MGRDEVASSGSPPQSSGAMSRRPSMPFKAVKVRGVVGIFLSFMGGGVGVKRDLSEFIILKMQYELRGFAPCIYNLTVSDFFLKN